MTIQAGRHGKRRNLFYHVHILDTTMAVLAMYSRVDMKAVTEINIVRKLMNSLPRDWPIILEIFREFDDVSLGFPRYRVTIHASARRRYNRISRPVDTYVAVRAINSHCAGMEFMGKWNRLCRCISDTFPGWSRDKVSDGDQR